MSSIIAYLIYRRAGLYEKGAPKRILTGMVKRVMSSSVSIASMVAMAVIMQHSGMTDTLARGLAFSMGWAYPVVAPWIGALGAFMTGSNTNSNVVFGALRPAHCPAARLFGCHHPGRPDCRCSCSLHLSANEDRGRG